MRGSPYPGRTTLLLVANEDVVRRSIADLLREDGYRVLEARDPARAIELLRSPGRPDLVIADQDLHGDETGAQIIALLRTRYPGLPAIVVAGHGQAPDAPDVVVLSKPFKPRALMVTVAESLSRTI